MILQLQGQIGMEASKIEQKEDENMKKKGFSEVGEKKSGKKKKAKGRKLTHVAVGRCVRMAKITNFLALEGSEKRASHHMHHRVEETTLVSEVRTKIWVNLHVSNFFKLVFMS